MVGPPPEIFIFRVAVFLLQQYYNAKQSEGGFYVDSRYQRSDRWVLGRVRRSVDAHDRCQNHGFFLRHHHETLESSSN
jgi:hypothetical protein